MIEFITYLGQSALCLVALYLIYKATMSYETLHRLNRVTLLAMVVLSAVLPLCRIEIVREVVANPTPIVVEMGTAAVAIVADTTSAVNFRAIAEYVLVVLFLSGAALMVVRLVLSWLSVVRMVRSGEREELGEGMSLTVVDKLSSPFSWFSYIVVARSDMAEHRDMILEHEMAHVRLRHSWDVMFIDLALILWWFNPAMWLLRRELQSLHEYQADDAVLNRGIDAKTYQLLLIKRAVGSRLHSVANCLNHSNLKNRITMMCRNQSSKWQSAKLLFVLPMVAISLSAFATTVYVETKSDDKVIEKNDKNKAISTVRLAGDKIYLNDKKLSYDELATYLESNKTLLNIKVANDESKENLAKVRELARQNQILTINYEQEQEDAKKVQVYMHQLKDLEITKQNFEQMKAEYEAARNEILAHKDEYAKYEKQYAETMKQLSEFEQHLKEAESEIVKEKALLEEQINKAQTSQSKMDLRQVFQMQLRGVGSVGVVNATITLNPNGTYEHLVVEKDPNENITDCGALISEVERALKAAIKDAELPKEKKTYKFTISFCVKFANNVTRQSAVKVGGDAIIVTSYADSTQTPQQKNELAGVKVEKMPTFQGGDLNKFRDWIQANVKYPKVALDAKIKGRVIFSFVVEKDGSLSEFDVLNDANKSLADEVERVFKIAPNDWVAGEQNGKKVRVKLTVPITFVLPNAEAAENK